MERSDRATKWRQTIKQSLLDFKGYTESAPDDEWLLTSLANGNATFEQEKAHQNSPGIFFWGVALVTYYGRLDVVEDVLNNIPPDSKKAPFRFLANSLKDILPLPAILNPIDQPEAVKLWFQENRNQLKWDDERKFFVLSEEDDT